jgi:copper chaperone
MSQELTYTVEGMTCTHCTAAVTTELLAQAGVIDVDVDLDTKQVVVAGARLDDEALRAAIARAGYEAA